MNTIKFSVWVGGIEVNDNLLTLDEAQRIAKNWLDEGYDDVQLDAYREVQDAQAMAYMGKSVG